MKPLSLISFELLVASCIRLTVSIIMIHDNSMHTLHTVICDWNSNLVIIYDIFIGVLGVKY